MPIQIGQRADHGFDEPLGLLSDCHRRIEHFLNVLATVAADAAGGELTSSYRTALEAAIKYFAVAAPKHTADEEESLFPRLRACGDRQLGQTLTSLDRLEHDHQEADTNHAAVDALVRRWLADGRLAAADVADLRGRLARLQALYREHIAIEDQEVFPAAARLLARAELEQIGGEMAARRGVTGRTHNW
jgi:hemerythrin-like domain-containing protein